MIEPARVKRYIIIAIQVMIVLEVISAMAEGLMGEGWDRFGFDLVVAGVLAILWTRFKKKMTQTRFEVREKIEKSGEDLRLRDALAFSLLWSDEIYEGIPKDRNRLVVISYTLIGIGLLVGSVLGDAGFMHLIVSAILVLGAVNLLAWVVSAERGEKETLRTELDLAHRVQSSLMPKQDPVIPGFDISGRSVPAREVGGDHFAYQAANGGLNVSIFDVSGKGMQAAMSAVFVNGALAAELQSARSPAETLTRLNKSFYTHSRRGDFVAFLLVSLNPQSRSLVFANAGQVKPLLINGEGPKWLEGKGVNFPLGMIENASYSDRELHLESGDVLLLFTDGVTEAMNEVREMFSSERIEALMGRLDLVQHSSVQVIETIFGEVRDYMNTSPQHDDMTMVAIKVL